MSNKIKINPSRLKLSTRCDYAAALRYMVDPDTGYPYKPFFAKTTKDRMNHGIYFEECLTGKPHVPRPDEEDRYTIWKARSKGETKNRIQSFAEYCKRFIDYDQHFETGIRIEAELPDLILYGILDYRGNLIDHQGNSRKLIVDFKFTADISYVWDFGNGANAEQYLQVPLYCMMDAIEQSKSVGTYEMFEEAILLTHRHKVDKANELVDKWAETIEILDGAYLICESKDVPVFINQDGNKTYKAPEVRIQLLDTNPRDFLYIYFWKLLEKEIRWGDYALSNNKYDRAIAQEINANQYKCLGVGRLTETKGRCPMIHACPYGNGFLSGTHRAAVSEIIRSA